MLLCISQINFCSVLLSNILGTNTSHSIAKFGVLYLKGTWYGDVVKYHDRDIESVDLLVWSYFPCHCVIGI